MDTYLLLNYALRYDNVWGTGRSAPRIQKYIMLTKMCMPEVRSV
jgi:hypothetical protein